MLEVIRHFHYGMGAFLRNDGRRCSEWFEVVQRVRQGCVRSPLLFKVFFAAILLVALERISEDADMLVDLAHLQEKPSKVGPETALECARRAIWRMLYDDEACIVSRSDDGGLRRSLRRIRSDHLREQDGDHVHTDSTCTCNADSLQRHGAAVPPDNLLHLVGRRRHWNSKPIGRYRPADPRGVDELPALHAGALRSPEGKSAVLEGPDGEIRGSRGSPIRMRDMDLP